MTKEHAILVLDSLSTWLGYERPITEEIVEAIKTLSQPSLSSNLDEAADKFNREDAARMWDYEGKTEGEIVEYAFKAGAAWMAGQGVTLEGHVCKDEYATEAPFYYVETENSDDFLPLIDNLIDNKVVVQIRKK